MGELAGLGKQLDAQLGEMWQYYYGGWDYPDVCFETEFGYYDDAPKEGDFGGLRSNITSAMKDLCYSGQGAVAGASGMMPQKGYSKIETIGDDFVQWDGRARDSFDDNVKDQVRVVPESLFVAASALIGALDAEAELWDKARDDVKTLANKALSTCDHADDKGSGGASFGLTVLAAVGTIALSVATAGAGTAVAVAVASTAIGAASVAASGVTVDWGDTEDPADIINAVNKGLGKINKAIGEREAIITKGLSQLATAVNSDLNHGPWGKDSYPQFLFKRPYLAGHTGGLGSWTGA